MATYAIGDIQGCYEQLLSLLEKLKFDPLNDCLWIAGDLINRGPDNVSTLDFLMGLPNIKIVLGNHDLHFIAAARGFGKKSSKDTHHDLLDHPKVADYCNFLRQQPLILMQGEYVMSHAGIPPNWTISAALSHGAEVSEVLSSDHCDTFLAKMYGNQPDIWQDQLQGIDRLRVITNYLTRLRFCTPEGQVELTHKSDIAPKGFKPWFDCRETSETKILFGHWAAINGHTGRDDIIALDTGCVWGGTLTALNLETGNKISVTGL